MPKVTKPLSGKVRIQTLVSFLKLSYGAATFSRAVSPDTTVDEVSKAILLE